MGLEQTTVGSLHSRRSPARKAHLLALIGRSGEGQLAYQTYDMKRRWTSNGINLGNVTRWVNEDAKVRQTSGWASVSAGVAEETMTLLTTADCNLTTLVGVRGPILQGCHFICRIKFMDITTVRGLQAIKEFFWSIKWVVYSVLFSGRLVYDAATNRSMPQ